MYKWSGAAILANYFKNKYYINGFFMARFSEETYLKPEKSPLCSSLLIFVIINRGSASIMVDGMSKELSTDGDNVLIVRPRSVVDSIGFGKDCDGVIIAYDEIFLISNINMIRFVPDLASEQFSLMMSLSSRIDESMLQPVFSTVTRFIENMHDKDHVYWAEKLRLNAIEVHLEITNLFKKGFRMKNIRQNIRQGGLFRRFIIMLRADIGKSREVRYYAERLCVSPKYLNAVVKNVSNKSASSIIDEVTLMTAANSLRDEFMPIGEVAARVGFATQAAFTKFFKKHTGMSPREFRNY